MSSNLSTDEVELLDELETLRMSDREIERAAHLPSSFLLPR